MRVGERYFVVWAANKSMGVYESLLVRNCECVFMCVCACVWVCARVSETEREIMRVFGPKYETLETET